VSRSFWYHPHFPEGKLFDDDEPPPKSAGWTENRGELRMTREQMTDKMIENAVRAELAAQGEHRGELEAEHRKKYGVAPDMRATNDEIANVMDNKTADGRGKLASRHFTRRT